MTSKRATILRTVDHRFGTIDQGVVWLARFIGEADTDTMWAPICCGRIKKPMRRTT